MRLALFIWSLVWLIWNPVAAEPDYCNELNLMPGIMDFEANDDQLSFGLYGGEAIDGIMILKSLRTFEYMHADHSFSGGMEVVPFSAVKIEWNVTGRVRISGNEFELIAGRFRDGRLFDVEDVPRFDRWDEHEYVFTLPEGEMHAGCTFNLLGVNFENPNHTALNLARQKRCYVAILMGPWGHPDDENDPKYSVVISLLIQRDGQWVLENPEWARYPDIAARDTFSMKHSRLIDIRAGDIPFTRPIKFDMFPDLSQQTPAHSRFVCGKQHDRGLVRRGFACCPRPW